MSNEKNVNIAVDKDLWKEVGFFSLMNDKPKKEIVNTALRQFLKNESERKKF